MGLIERRFPQMSVPHLKELAGLVATERNAVVRVNRMFKESTWGLGCLCCEAVLRKVGHLAGTATYPWLGFTREVGMAYTVTVDKVPMRIQPDGDEVRPMMPGEAIALHKLRAVQTSVFDVASAHDVLRLETTQMAGQLVSDITLYLLNENSGVTLDRIPLYSSAESSSDFERPPADVDTSSFYSFDPANDQAGNGDS